MLNIFFSTVEQGKGSGMGVGRGEGLKSSRFKGMLGGGRGGGCRFVMR